MRFHLGALVGLVLLAAPVTAGAQQDAPNIGTRLMNDAAIRAAIDAIKASEAQTIEDQVRLCEVEAPPFKESKRAEVYAKMFRELGLNIPMNLWIPAITIDGGGRGRGSHALDENFDQTNSFQGSQRALLLCIALAQP
jgi:hypothetical protein